MGTREVAAANSGDSTDGRTDVLQRAQLGADVLRALTAGPDLATSLQRCAAAIVDNVDAAFARIWVLNEFDRVLELQASAGIYTHLDGPHGRVPVGKFKIGLIAQERTPHLTNAVAHDSRIGDPEWARAEGMVAFAGYPLLTGERIVGVVALFARHELSANTLTSLADVADAIAVGIDRDRVSADREKLIAQLDEQSRLLEAVIRQMPAGVVIAEAPSGRLLLANRLAEQYQHPLAWRERSTTDPDVGAVSISERWPLRRALERGEVIRGEEIEHRLADGTEVNLLASAAPVLDPSGRIVAGVATMIDVTAARRSEVALRESEARKSAMLESALDCVVAIDSQGRFIEFNPAAEATFGYERAEVLGQRMADLIIPPPYRAAHEAGLARYLAGGEARVLGRRIELEGMRREGSTFPMELAIVSTTSSISTSFTAYLRDITDRKAAEIALTESRARMTRLAHTLQTSLIPPALPHIEGLDLAGVYRPAGIGDEVGGDFYDVFETAPGDWAIVVGDICGKGAEAAAVTALARYTVRAAAMQARRPKQVLAALNRAVFVQHPDRFCTVVYARVRRIKGRFRVTVSSGGHPLPVRTAVDGTTTEVGSYGCLIGAFDEVSLVDTQVDLEPGETLTFFTDGVTEGRSEQGFYGDERVADMLSNLRRHDADTIANRLVDDVVAFQQDRTRDDIAVVVIKPDLL